MESTRKQEKTSYWRASYLVLIICCALGWLYVVLRLPEASWVPVVFIPVVAAGSLVIAIPAVSGQKRHFTNVGEWACE